MVLFYGGEMEVESSKYLFYGVMIGKREWD